MLIIHIYMILYMQYKYVIFNYYELIIYFQKKLQHS